VNFTKKKLSCDYESFKAAKEEAMKMMVKMQKLSSYDDLKYEHVKVRLCLPLACLSVFLFLFLFFFVIYALCFLLFLLFDACILLSSYPLQRDADVGVA